MKILLVGYGRMGRMIEQTAQEMGIEVAAKVDVDTIGELENMGKVADALLDFSSPASLDAVCSYIKRTGCAYLCGTTGHTPSQLEEIRRLEQYAAVLHSANYSLGIAVFRRVLRQVTDVLKEDFDIEVTETHHNQKVDAPSGTAKLLLDTIDPNGEYDRVYGRSGICGKRSKKEIGVHAIRGGTVAGEHTVGFYGTDEVLEIRHTAASRQIFARGALKAAVELIKYGPGYYTLDQLLFK